MIQPSMLNVVWSWGLYLFIASTCLLPASLMAEGADFPPLISPVQSPAEHEPDRRDLHNAPTPPTAHQQDAPKPKRLERSERETLNRELRETLRNVYDRPKRRD